MENGNIDLGQFDELEAQDESISLSDSIAPRSAGHYTIGYVDQLHGPGAEEKNLRVSRYEVHVVASHWVAEITNINALWYFHRCTGSSELRIEVYAHSRLNRLVRAGLLTSAEVNEMIAREEALRGIDWGVVPPGPEEGQVESGDGLVDWSDV